jgi:hypothetical protein
MQSNIYECIYIYIYIHIYMRVCVCVRVAWKATPHNKN